MTQRNDGGTAFPVTLNPGESYQEHSPFDGMALRDYFAAKAIPAVYADYCASARVVGFDEDWKMGVALDAYAMADAMLAARERT